MARVQSNAKLTGVTVYDDASVGTVKTMPSIAYRGNPVDTEALKVQAKNYGIMHGTIETCLKYYPADKRALIEKLLADAPNHASLMCDMGAQFVGAEDFPGNKAMQEEMLTRRLAEQFINPDNTLSFLRTVKRTGLALKYAKTEAEFNAHAKEGFVNVNKLVPQAPFKKRVGEE